MRIRLLFPPVFETLRPYPSIFYLKGFLKRHGYTDVKGQDLNLRYWHTVYKKHDVMVRELKRRADRILKGGWGVPDDISNLINDAERVKADVPKAVQYFCRDEIVNESLRTTERYYRALRISERLVEFLHPDDHVLTEDYFSSSFQNRIISSPDFPYAWFYDEQFRRMRRAKPEFIGISLVFLDQIVHALALARWSKLYFPKAHVCVGGPVLTDVFMSRLDNKETRKNIFKYVDSVVLGEGEHSIVELIEYLEGKRRALPKYSSVVFRRKAQVASVPSPHEALYEPDYTDLEYSKYFNYHAPGRLVRRRRKAIFFLASRGCFWRKCRFCKSYLIYRGYEQCRNYDKLVTTIRSYQKRFGVRSIGFNDEAMSLPQVERLSRSILENRLRIEWYTNMRVEPSITRELCELAYHSGLRTALIGTESGSQRIVDLMNKGINLEVAERMIRILSAVGVGVQLYMMSFYPGETVEDIRRSVDFVTRNRAHIGSFVLATFVGHVNAPIFHLLKRGQYSLPPRKYDLSTNFFPKREPTRAMRSWHDRLLKLSEKSLFMP